MTYYKLKIIRHIFELNISQGRWTTVYIAVKHKLDNELLRELNWAIISSYQIPSYEFAWHLLTKTVTNHTDCFHYIESVVIE